MHRTSVEIKAFGQAGEAQDKGLSGMVKPLTLEIQFYFGIE
jgi:hypothetical protein